jgi:hypothetical protein
MMIILGRKFIHHHLATYLKLLVSAILIALVSVETVHAATTTSSQSISNGGGSATLEDVTIVNNSSNTCTFTVSKYSVPPGGAPPDPGEMPLQWNITSDGNCGMLNINLIFSYTDLELANGNNVSENQLKAFRNTGGVTWVPQNSTCDTNANTVTVTGMTSLSNWTLGDAVTSGNSYPSPITLQSTRAHSSVEGFYAVLLAGVGILLIGGLSIFWQYYKRRT